MNSADPISQIKDIHLPDAIGLWPPAPGWWLLALLLICGIIAGIFLVRQHVISNRYRRGAETLLSTIWQQYQTDQDGHAYLRQLTQILRRTAITAYPSQPVKALQGEAWLSFLETTGSTHGAFTGSVGRQLLTLPYQPSITNDLTPLHELISAWIKHHKRHLIPNSVNDSMSTGQPSQKQKEVRHA